MANRLNKVSRTLAKIRGCKISIIVIFPKEKLPVMSVTRSNYDGMKEENVYIDIPAFLIFELPYEASPDYLDRTIYMNDVSKVQFVSILKKISKILQTKDVFYIDEQDRVQLYIDMQDPDKFLVSGKVGDTSVACRPVVLENKEGFTEEGVRIMVRNRSSFVDLSYYEIQAIIDIVRTANIFLYSQVLLNGIGFDPMKKKNQTVKARKEEMIMDRMMEEMEIYTKRMQKAELEESEESKEE